MPTFGSTYRELQGIWIVACFVGHLDGKPRHIPNVRHPVAVEGAKINDFHNKNTQLKDRDHTRRFTCKFAASPDQTIHKKYDPCALRSVKNH